MKQSIMALITLILVVIASIIVTGCNTTKNYNKKPKVKHKLTVAYQPCFK